MDYTKGEWKAKKILGEWVIMTDDDLICREVRHFNAHLISQAPRLYEACKGFFDAWDGGLQLAIPLKQMRKALAEADSK